MIFLYTFNIVDFDGDKEGWHRQAALSGMPIISNHEGIMTK